MVLHAQQNKKILITGSRFTYTYVEALIAEYKIINPEVEIVIIPRGANTDSSNLFINGQEIKPGDLKPGYTTRILFRYGLLPVYNQHSQHLNAAFKDGLGDEQIKQLFFPVQKGEKSVPVEVGKYQVYTREQSACAPVTFAQHFGLLQSDISGEGIAGDDKQLLTAISKDTNGVSYNVLSNIYDLKSRKLKTDIAVIKLDLNNNHRVDPEEDVYNNLDQVIALYETNKSKGLIIGYINFSFNTENSTVKEFVNWVAKQPEQKLHQYGYLKLK